MSLPYFPMYPRDFFEGTQEMSLELKGAYIMVLNLLYTRGGPVSDEPGFISRYVGCSVRKWKQVRDELVAMGKLYVQNGMISNSRADQVIEKQRSYQDKQAENGAKPKTFKAEEKPSLTESKPEPNTEVEDEVEEDRASDFEALEAKCRKWANGSLNLTLPSAHSLDPIIRLLKPSSGPACIEADVERGITTTAAWLHSKRRQVKSLSYFEKAIIEARDERLRPNPEVSDVNANFGGGEPRRRGPGSASQPAARYAPSGHGAFGAGQSGRGSIADAAIRRHLQRQNGNGIPGGNERGSDVPAEGVIVDADYRRVG